MTHEPEAPPALTRMIYVDDSGSDLSGIVVYGWVEVAPHRWASVLREWLTFRKRLVADYGIQVTTELHSTEYMQGRAKRGSLTKSPPERFRRSAADGSVASVLWKDLGREVAVECLRAVQSIPDLRMGAVWRRTDLTRAEYGEFKYALYQDLVSMLDAELCAGNELAVVSMDGDDPHYRAAHRVLDLQTRHLLEDPTYHDSRHSQWTQLADLVAYCAYMHVNRHSSQQFGWSWYTDYLADADKRGGPVRL